MSTRAADDEDDGLTCYERARLVEHRARQLERNARPRVAVPPDVTCPVAVALLELRAGVLPARVVRRGAADAK